MKNKVIIYLLTLAFVFTSAANIFALANDFYDVNINELDDSNPIIEEEPDTPDPEPLEDRRLETEGYDSTEAHENSVDKNELEVSEEETPNGVQGNGDKTFTVTKKVGDAEEKVGDFDKFYDAVGSMDVNDKVTFYTIYLNNDAVVPADQMGGYYRTNSKFRLTSGQGGPFTLKREGTRGLLGIQTDAELTVDNITLDGSETTQCFFISNNGKVTLGSGATIQNFVDTKNEDGPAIYMTGSATLNIEEGVIVQNNTGKRIGGVIGDNSKDTTININGGTFTENSCEKRGGVIGSYGTLNISGGAFKGNSSREGGVIASYGKLNITGGVFENNSAKTNGGAIRLGQNAIASIRGASFNKNEAKSGGAIYNSNELIINDGVTFSENKSNDNGGAIINYGKLTVNGGTFKGNEAKNGGAISSTSDYGELTIVGGTFENNKSTGKWGGAIVAKNIVSVKNATFDGNVSGNGGAIFAYDANGAAIENCTFKNNSATNENTVKHGGALFVNGGKDVSIKSNTFIKNTAKDGGALNITGVEGVIEGNTFEENFADRFSSAFHLKDSSVAITSNTFKNNGKNEDNVTSAGTFMVESVKNNGTIEANGNTFENNTAGLGGAAVLQAGTVDFNGCSFNKNNASEYGGAMYITKNATANITNSKFEENSAKRGGAIVTEKFSQANPAEKTKYKNLTIADDVVFDKNFASDGYFNPPTNYKDFPDLKFKTTSLMGQLRAIKADMKTYEKVDSLLNNYDVYYVNPLVTVIYDSNGGSPAEKIYGEELKSEDDEIIPTEHNVKSIKETGLTKKGFEFKGWNTQADGKGTVYKEGDKIEVSSNKILYAQWEAEEPEPQPEPQPYDPGYFYYETEKAKPVERDLDVYRWYMEGNENNEFMPKKGITRAEMAQIFARALAYDGYKTYGDYNPYPDVRSDKWYYQAILTTTEAGVFKGTDMGTFEPEREITQAELIATISRFQKLINKEGNAFEMKFDHWAKPEVQAAYEEKWLELYKDGRANFNADAVISREEVATILNKAFGRPTDKKYIEQILKDKKDTEKNLKTFKDIDKDMWSYYEILTAANTYAVKYKDKERTDYEWYNHAIEDDGPSMPVEKVKWYKGILNNDKYIDHLYQIKFQREMRRY